MRVQARPHRWTCLVYNLYPVTNYTNDTYDTDDTDDTDDTHDTDDTDALKSDELMALAADDAPTEETPATLVRQNTVSVAF